MVPIVFPSGKEREQVVRYEYEPKYCSICKSIRHEEGACRTVGISGQGAAGQLGRRGRARQQAGQQGRAGQEGVVQADKVRKDQPGTEQQDVVQEGRAKAQDVQKSGAGGSISGKELGMILEVALAQTLVRTDPVAECSSSGKLAKAESGQRQLAEGRHGKAVAQDMSQGDMGSDAVVQVSTRQAEETVPWSRLMEEGELRADVANVCAEGTVEVLPGFEYGATPAADRAAVELGIVVEGGIKGKASLVEGEEDACSTDMEEGEEANTRKQRGRSRIKKAKKKGDKGRGNSSQHTYL